MKSSPRPILAAALAAAIPSFAAAQDWYRENPETSPPARRFHAMGSLAGETILFGGVDERTNTVFGDTWRHDGRQWAELQPQRAPSPRQRFASCVDGSRGAMFVFGGSDANGQPLGDTWAFVGGDWHLVTATGPSPRAGAAMAFDAARDRIVLFGGFANEAGSPDDETWEFDGSAWTQRFPSQAPTARQGHAMTHDPARGVSILFGGFAAGGNGFDVETWEYDGSEWGQVVTPNVPTAAVFGAMTFFAPHGVAVLTGGGGSPSQRLATWAYDGADWHQGPAAPPGFTSRQGHAMAFDAVREAVVLFGGATIGFGGARPLDETWELSTPATFEPFGIGCSGTASSIPVLGLRAVSKPAIGTTFELEVSGAGPFAIVALGQSDAQFGNVPLPADLSTFGLPGCSLLVSVDHVASAVTDGTFAVAGVPLPLRTDLLGAVFFAQAMSVVPSAGGLSGSMSNAGRATIGN